jgi:hypothetical protein
MKRNNLLSVSVSLLAIAFSTTAVHAQNLLWAKNYNNLSWDQGYGVASDNNGNVYSVGIFDNYMEFGPSMSAYSAGINDLFIIKQNSAGVVQWARAIGNAGNEVGQSIEVDPSGNVYVTGQFEQTVDFDPGSGVASLVCNGMSDAFLLKLDNAGNFVWVKQLGGSDVDAGHAVDTDTDGSVVVSGVFSGTADLDPNAGTMLATSNGYRDAFIVKIKDDGTFLWAKHMGGSMIDEFPYSVHIDKDGNVLSTGTYAGTVDFDPGAGTFNLTDFGAFIQKLDSNGNFIWAKSDYSSTGYDITSDNAGNVILTGIFFPGSVATIGSDFDPGAGNCTFFSNGGNDIFIQKLSPSGDFIWAKQIGTSGHEWANTIAVDSYNNIYTAGTFWGTADFDPGPGSTIFTSGTDDTYILKFDASGNLGWAKQITGVCNENAMAMSINNLNEVFVCGYFSSSVDFDPGAPVTNLTANAGNDIFVIKLSASQSQVGITENMLGNFSVYPNPFSDQLTVDAGQAKDAELIITDVQGRMFHQRSSVSGMQQLDLSNLPAGAYFIRVISSEGQRTLPLLKN